MYTPPLAWRCQIEIGSEQGPSPVRTIAQRVGHSWTKLKKPAKNKVKKFVKLMNHTCTCNDLTSFEYKTHSPETEICLEEHVKSHQVNSFLAGFSYLEPLCSGLSSAASKWFIVMEHLLFSKRVSNGICCYLLPKCTSCYFLINYSGKRLYETSLQVFFCDLLNPEDSRVGKKGNKYLS